MHLDIKQFFCEWQFCAHTHSIECLPSSQFATVPSYLNGLHRTATKLRYILVQTNKYNKTSRCEQIHKTRLNQYA